MIIEMSDFDQFFTTAENLALLELFGAVGGGAAGSVTSIGRAGSTATLRHAGRMNRLLRSPIGYRSARRYGQHVGREAIESEARRQLVKAPASNLRNAAITGYTGSRIRNMGAETSASHYRLIKMFQAQQRALIEELNGCE